jgi:hypothetical protein
MDIHARVEEFSSGRLNVARRRDAPACSSACSRALPANAGGAQLFVSIGCAGRSGIISILNEFSFSLGDFFKPQDLHRRGNYEERPMLRKFFAFAALPMVLSCAPFQQASAENDLTPQQSSQINDVCKAVMGLRPGEQYYADCQDSLMHSMTRLMAAQGMGDAAEQCRAQGLAQGSAALSVCMLDHQNNTQRRTATIQPVNITQDSAALQSGKSYYDVTPSTRWQRERYSCAQLGLMPGSGLFGECVASLDGEMQPDE